LEENPIFEDRRASRPLVPGSISRGDLRDDDALFTGKVDGELVDQFPMTITQEIIEHGGNRFNIYCAPCHSKLGDGNGMIVQRGVTRPPSFTDERLTTAPVGHIYDVITNGYGRMYSYNQQLPVHDRWAIVAYVKALQAAGRGTIEDVPESERAQLMQMEPVSTATANQLRENRTSANVDGAAPAGGTH
jgi:mono/diheme cytochrome c family protein